MMDIGHLSAFEGCYIMQREDIARFAGTLADGFSNYDLFKYACNWKYDHHKMATFWAVTIAANYNGSICIADSKEANSVLVYIRPESKEPGILDYLKAGGIKIPITLGLRTAIKLLQFESYAQKIAKKYRTDKDGYLLAFATRQDKQGQNFGKPLIEALMRYLRLSGEGCYLETLKKENVDLYRHFSFELMEHTSAKSGNLTLYAMKTKKS